MAVPDGLDLSGAWSGVYRYPKALKPVSFSAVLTETGSWLVGTTQEVASASVSRGLNLTATLQGRRTGRDVTWLKTYDGEDPAYDAVRYQGIISADGTTINGIWIVPSNWSGTFTMTRPVGTAAAIQRKIAEMV